MERGSCPEKLKSGLSLPAPLCKLDKLIPELLREKALDLSRKIFHNYLFADLPAEESCCCRCRAKFCPCKQWLVPRLKPNSESDLLTVVNESSGIRLIENLQDCQLGLLSSGHMIEGKGAVKALSKKRA